MAEETTGATSTTANATETGQTATSQGQTTNEQSQQKTQLNTLPPDIQDYIKRLRDEAATANDEAKKLKQTQDKAEQERLKKQGEFQTLAEKHEARVKELEPVIAQYSERYEKLSSLLNARVQTETKDWPKEVKDLLPTGDKVDPLDYLEAVEKYRPLAERLKGGTAGSTSGNRANPKPAGANNPFDPDTLKARMKAQLGL